MLIFYIRKNCLTEWFFVPPSSPFCLTCPCFIHPSELPSVLSTPLLHPRFFPSSFLTLLQGRGALWPPHHSAGPETWAPGCLHYTQQHRLLPEWTEPHSDPGAGRQLPAPRQVPVRHHHPGKRAEHAELCLVNVIKKIMNLAGGGLLPLCYSWHQNLF